ncbi:MAG: hypothetical protein QOK27_2680, partial [Gemmatimonadales bacterium]|nr:hypothetical protein [Gemmatimonadales bacterium]
MPRDEDYDQLEAWTRVAHRWAAALAQAGTPGTRALCRSSPLAHILDEYLWLLRLPIDHS